MEIKLTDECKAVVNYIIEKTNEYDSNKTIDDRIRNFLSINKVNRILFLFQICYVEKYGKPAFEDEFYAWTSGPAIEKTYYEYNYNCGSKLGVASTNCAITNEMKEIIEDLFVYAKHISTKKLTEIVKRCELWYSVYDPNDSSHHQVISNDKILEYCRNYKGRQLIKAKDFR